MTERWPWYIAGPILGLLIVGLRALLNKPFGALGGYVNLVENASRPRSLGFRTFLLLGFVLGGALFANTLGVMTPTGAGTTRDLLSAGGSHLALLIVGGVLMGFGARTAGGCTSGHGMSGVSIGSPASVVSTMTFFAAAVALTNVWAWIAGGVR